LITFELLGKRIEMIREVVPKALTIGLLVNPSNATAAISERNAQEAVRLLDRRIVTAGASSAVEFGAAFASLVRSLSYRTVRALQHLCG